MWQLRLRHRLSASIGLIVLTPIALLLAFPQAAQAHSTLIATEPVAFSTLRALPEDVKLTFATPLVDDPRYPSNSITITDPTGRVINTDVTTLSGKSLSTVLTPKKVLDGIYTVTFRAVAQDGFGQGAQFQFTVNSHLNKASFVPGVIVPTAGTVDLAVAATGSQILGGRGAKSPARARATFHIDFATRTMCYSIKTNGLGQVTGIHVHAANMMTLKVSEEIYVPIDLAAVNAAKPVCAKQDGASLAKLAADPTKFVMMVHTASYPEGAVSGTMTDPASEPPANTTESAATSSATSAVWWFIGLALVALVLIYVVARVMSKSWGTDDDDEMLPVDAEREHDLALRQ